MWRPRKTAQHGGCSPRCRMHSLQTSSFYYCTCYVRALCKLLRTLVSMAALCIEHVPSASKVCCSATLRRLGTAQHCRKQPLLYRKAGARQRTGKQLSCCFHAQSHCCRLEVNYGHRRADTSRQRKAASRGSRQGLARPAHNLWCRSRPACCQSLANLAQGATGACCFLCVA